MSRHSVELVMDRLLTDAALRHRFGHEPMRVLAELSYSSGVELTLDEMRAFLRTAPEWWRPTLEDDEGAMH